MDVVAEIRCAIEVREDASRASPGLLTGTLLTYGERATDRPELFVQDSLTWPQSGVVLNSAHNQQQPIMMITPVVEGRELRISQRLPDTAAGRDAATNIRNGLFKGLSVEFNALHETRNAGIREIRSAQLVGAGLVHDPSYRTSVEVRASDKQRIRRLLLCL